MLWWWSLFIPVETLRKTLNHWATSEHPIHSSFKTGIKIIQEIKDFDVENIMTPKKEENEKDTKEVQRIPMFM